MGRGKGRSAAALFGLTLLTTLGLSVPADAAVFTVTRGDDPAPDPCVSGVDCSLREAINAANASGVADEIIVTQDVTLTIPGTEENANANGDLDVPGGAGADLLIRSDVPGTRRTITAVASERVLDGFNSNLTLRDLAITGGTADQAVLSRGGGLEYVGFGKTLRLENTRVHNNSAALAGQQSMGGGLYASSGEVEIVGGSRIENNSVSHGILNQAGSGGGLAMEGVATATISDSFVIGNRAATSDGVSNPNQGRGGGIYYSAQGIGPQTLTITDSAIEQNKAGGLGTTQSLFFGGGIFAESSTAEADPVVSITRGTVSQNTVGGGEGGSQGAGGGIRILIQGLADGGSLNLTDVELTANRAGGSDGVGDPPTNTAGGFGAGINANVDTTVTGGLIQDGRAGVVEGNPMLNISGTAGGIFTESNAPATSDLTLTGVRVEDNRAGNGTGAGGGHGAGITATNTGSLTISNSTVSGNQAVGLGGGIQRMVDNAGDPDSISDSTISGNTTSSGIAGGISLDTERLFTINRSLLSGNQVTGATGWGGAIVANSFSAAPDPRGTLRLVNSTVTGNTAGDATSILALGGGITMGTGQPIDFEAVFSTIASNTLNRGVSNPPFGRGGNIGIHNAPMAPDAPTVTFIGTIVSDGTVTGGGTLPNCSFGANVGPTSNGGNLEGPPTAPMTPGECDFDNMALGDQVGLDPMLAGLADNGGATQTRRLLTGSPAIDAAPNAVCVASLTTTDQRGYPRPFPTGGSCDSGAYERFICNGAELMQPGPFPGCLPPQTPGTGGGQVLTPTPTAAPPCKPGFKLKTIKRKGKKPRKKCVRKKKKRKKR